LTAGLKISKVRLRGVLPLPDDPIILKLVVGPKDDMFGKTAPFV
jgi:hypothetical protein